VLVGQRILANVAALPAGPLNPSLSIGIALGGPDDDLHQLLAAADQAMYRAKREGGGRMAVAGSAAGEDLYVGDDEDSVA
jgi:GGDEF domain-containing protein